MEPARTAEPVPTGAASHRPIRVLLAEDHATVRQGLRLLLQELPGVEVVAEAEDVSGAIDCVRRETPELVLLDISMPGAGGLSAIGQILELHPLAEIVVLTRHRDQAFVRESLGAGASAYVLKQSPFNELQLAIAAVVAGERYVDRQLASGQGPWKAATSGPLRVSDREWDVLQRTALGHGNREVAAALNIAVKTVEVHKANGMRKLGLHDRCELVRYAVAKGWLREA